MTTIASSSSSSATAADAFHPKKYDVFVSFRGEDTRRNFISHLCDALRQKQIKTYIDDRLNRGDEISSALSKAIEDSHISVLVFSKNYASSKWCLDELVKILECRSKRQDVLPVFYNVDPSHVRKQKGGYKKAFAKHKRDFKNNKDKLTTWKKALFEVANLAGWDSRIYGDESKLIHEIVKDVLRKLEYKYPPRESKCPFGINENLAPIELLLRELQTIGIWGMGGIGKTTIAKWLFDKYSSQYEGSCFLPNIRENSKKHGQALYELRNELVSKLLAEDERTTNVDSTFVKCRLCRKRVFIVFDDVGTSKQLEYLVGELQHCGSGSRIIITTRDKHVLSKGVDKIHKVKVLNSQESLQLFSLKAFNQNHPKMGNEELSKRAVDYAKGVPLALEVLGSFLLSKAESEWESALKKLKRNPKEEIQSVLRLSYDGLDYKEREIFLEIACFLKGDNKEYVIKLLDSYDFDAVIGLRTLQDKALITIENNFVWMHDLIQEMGWEIVRQESIKEPGRRSRLWDPEEVYDVLKNNRGTDAIEGIILDMSQIRDLELSVDTFRNMIYLRFLKFYLPWDARYSTVHLPSSLQLFSDKLRYLQWNRYPSKSLPLTFCPKKLVELLMPDSHVQKLWDGVQDVVNLKKIDLSRSRWLKELPDFPLSLNLEEVYLCNCVSLCHVHPSILSLHSLVGLYLRGCKELKSLESEIHLRSLKYLYLNDCSSLKKFSVSSEDMGELNLSYTSIECLPASIKQLTKLTSLNLNDCKKLQSLPELPQSISDLYLSGSNIECLPASIKQLTKLISLALRNCKKLQSLPELPQSILDLLLSGSNIECLPASIKQLTMLEFLFIQDCKRLRSLPELPQSIRYLDSSNCTLLETVITPKTSTPWTERRDLTVQFLNCLNLDEHARYSILEDSYSSIKQIAHEMVVGGRLADYFNQTREIAKTISICLPGSRVPKWFKYNRTKEDSITIQVDRSSQIVGCTFWVVLSPFSSNQHEYNTIKCFQYERSYTCGVSYGRLELWGELNSDHVYLWFDQGYSFSNLSTTCNLSFKFIVEKRNGERQPDVRIKECGICPIYASEGEFSHALVSGLGKKRGATPTHCGHSGNERRKIKKKKEGDLLRCLDFTEFIADHGWAELFQEYDSNM